MAHFAKINENSIVENVLVIPNNQEDRGQEFLTNDLGLEGIWIQTSFTSRNGNRVHPDTNEIIKENDHFRYNFASIGDTWDPNFGENGAFIPPKPEGMNSWVINLNSANWEPPIPFPDDGKPYIWNEENLSWVEVVPSNEEE